MTTLSSAKGDTVTLRYSIIFKDGTIIGDKKAKPLTFKIGSGKVFPVLEDGVIGMKINETRRITVSAEQGYGSYNEELVLRVERDAFPEDLTLVPGRTVQYQNRDGERANFVVQEVNKDIVALDGNHPLAGQELIYQLELLEIK